MFNVEVVSVCPSACFISETIMVIFMKCDNRVSHKMLLGEFNLGMYWSIIVYHKTELKLGNGLSYKK
jgi:hypothetical protein